MEQADLKSFAQYLHAIEKELAAGNATEHTHRPALKTLIEGLAEGITATNEPQHITAVGAPDFVINKGVTIIGYIEAKDVGKSLDEAEKSEQLQRYLGPLTNLILTDYLEFRWYVDGELRLSARLGTPTKEGKVKRDKAGVEPVAELLAGSLQDYRRGLIVGVKTSCRGSMQRVIPLPNGGAFGHTIYHCFTPAGKDIHGNGVTPDIIIENPPTGEDLQLQKAIDVLKQKPVG